MIQKISNLVDIPSGSNVNETVLELLESTGTNWSVQKQKLVSVEGLETKSYGIFRTDNNNWLGTMKEQYTPFQNADLAQTIVEASAELGKIYRGGSLQGGRKIFYQIALPDYKVGHDDIKRWLTIINSHDGTKSIAFGSTNTVVVCENTFNIAYRGLNKFRHTSSAKERIEASKAELVFALTQDQSLMQSYEKMTQYRIPKTLSAKIFNKLFNISPTDKLEDISARKKNQIAEFDKVYSSELASHGETLWGLFNAVTFYENHIGVKEDRKLDHIYIGGGKRNMLLTYNEIMAFIDSKESKRSLIEA